VSAQPTAAGTTSRGCQEGASLPEDPPVARIGTAAPQHSSAGAAHADHVSALLRPSTAVPAQPTLTTYRHCCVPAQQCRYAPPDPQPEQ